MPKASATPIYRHCQTVVQDDQTGAPVQCTITVYPKGSVNPDGTLIGTPTKSTIYSDEVGTSKSNPFDTTAKGEVDFYAAPGSYDLLCSGGSLSVPKGICDVDVGVGVDVSGNAWLTGAISVKATNEVLYADRYAGANMAAKINAAIADLDATKGGVIVIPPGIYEGATPIVCERSEVLLRGTGPQGVEIRQTGETGSVLRVGKAGEVAVHRFVAENITFKIQDGGTPHTNTSPAVQIINSHEHVFRGCRFVANQDAYIAQDGLLITCDVVDGCGWGHFDNCWFFGNGRHGLNITTDPAGAAGAWVNGNHLINCVFLDHRRADGCRAISIDAGKAADACAANVFLGGRIDTNNSGPYNRGGVYLGRATRNAFVHFRLDGYQTGEMLTFGADSLGNYYSGVVDGTVHDDGSQNHWDMLVAGYSSVAASPGGAVRSGNVVTITTTYAHNLKAGDVVRVKDVVPVGATSFNGIFTVASAPSTTTFTYAQTAADDTGGGGTARDNYFHDWCHRKPGVSHPLPLVFRLANLAANQTNVAVPPGGDANQAFVVMPCDGSLVGMQGHFAGTGDALTGGKLTVKARINDVDKLTADWVAADGYRSPLRAADKGDYAFAAGDRIAVVYTSTADMLPDGSLDLQVILLCERK